MLMDVCLGSSCCAAPSSRPVGVLPAMVVSPIVYAGPLALSEAERPAGPKQYGRGVHGQYVYWVTMPYPKAATIAKHSLKSPDAFTREEFCELIVKALADCAIDVLETAGFLEPHASGKPHHNCLLRAADHFRWKVPAEQLFDQYQIRVNFGTNIRTWAEGCVYGRVASEHKPPEALDQHPVPNCY